MKKATLIICLAMVLCILVCLLYKPIYYRIYFGDRIKGNVEVLIDGSTYSLGDDNIKLNAPGHTKINDDGTAFISLSGGDYGSYSFEISDMTAGSSVTVDCFQHNWWNVQSFELIIEIDTSMNTIKFSGNSTIVSDNGKKIREDIDKTQSLNDEDIQIRLGL